MSSISRTPPARHHRLTTIAPLASASSAGAQRASSRPGEVTGLGCALSRAVVKPVRPPAPVVLERPAGPDGPRLHEVRQPRRLELARRASRRRAPARGRAGRARRARRSARARPPPRGPRRAARSSPATSRTARRCRGGSSAGRTPGSSAASVRSPHAVRTSGSHRRSATASRRRGRERARPQQPAELRARPGHGEVVALERHHAGAEVALEPRRERLGAPAPGLLAREHRERAQRRVGDRLDVGVGERRRAASSRRGARCRRRRRPRPPGPRRRASPAGVRPPGVLARAVADEPAAGHERPLEPRRRPRATPARAPPSAPRRRASRAARGTTGSSRPSRSSAARRRGPASRARCARRGASGRYSWRILPGSSSVSGSSRSPLQRRERAQRRARDVGPRGQHLQRGDQRVAPEQRVVAARVALRHRRRRGVDPALGRQQRVEALDAHACSTTAPCQAPSVSAPSTASPSRARSVAIATRPARALDRDLGVGEVERDRVALAAPPRPRAGRRGQRLVGAARAGRAAPRRSAIRSRVRCSCEPASARWAATL